MVIAKVEGELLCRRLVHQAGLTALDTAQSPPQRLACSEALPLEVWGVVTTVIRQMALQAGSVFALVDVNNMYCSVERAFDPRPEGRPLVVLSSNDGACIARSNEAKALGVQMAQPWFQVRHLHKRHRLIALSANFELYSDMSARMRQERRTPRDTTRWDEMPPVGC